MTERESSGGFRVHWPDWICVEVLNLKFCTSTQMSSFFEFFGTNFANVFFFRILLSPHSNFAHSLTADWFGEQTRRNRALRADAYEVASAVCEAQQVVFGRVSVSALF